MIRLVFRTLALFVIVSLSCGLAGCDSDDSVKEDDPINLTGSWELTTVVTSNTCGIPNGDTKTETFYITEENNSILLINFNGEWGEGDVDNDEISFSGTESSDDFGCEAILSTEGSGVVSEDEIHGTFVTSVLFDQDTCPDQANCTITSSFTMILLEETTCYDRAVFGDPDSSEYILPYPVGTSYPVYQSYCRRTGGHRDQLAYDLTIPIGDTVVASRGGIVRAIKEDSPDDGQGEGQHNYIYIEHADGTSAFYAHLMQDGVRVEPGDTVIAGQEIASSGNSGYSGEPHLHIGVYQTYPPVEGNDVPINFRNADGPLDSRGGLIRGEYYTATPVP